MSVDFLIVAALADEANEVRRLLGDVRQEAECIFGTVQRWRGLGVYHVALLDLYGMGTNNAQAVVQDAIGVYQPRAVLMSGIAAGFQDGPAKVALGDLLVPYGIVPYELAKIRGPAQGSEAAAEKKWKKKRGKKKKRKDKGKKPITIEHRGMAWAVAESLWRTAANTAGDAERPWLGMLTEPRPDGSNVQPKIHAQVDAVIGCGEKVVAHEEAEVRKWLLDSYPRQALGLEMESYGALIGCRMFGTPFLLAKASVDKATLEKDDRWRKYACQLSAAFLITALQRYERPDTDLNLRHMAGCVQVAGTIHELLPKTDFAYKYRAAPSFEQIRQKILNQGERELKTLLPDDLHPDVALYAGGGAGKTTTVRRLFLLALKADLLPVMIDLKRLTQEGNTAGGQEQPEDVESIIRIASYPRRSAHEIAQLARQRRMLLIIDGVNEISKPAVAALRSFCQDLRRDGTCLCLWTNRMAPIEDLPSSTLHATVEQVSAAVAERCYDQRFGARRFQALNARLRSIFLRPFFLDLALRAGRPFTANRLWSGIFEEFFREHRSLSDSEIDQLAISTQEAIGPDARVRVQQMRDTVGANVWRKLTEAQVRVVEQSGEFEHHLWRDYLLARALRLRPERWTEDTFDAATTFGTSAECLSMAVEQIDQADSKTRFVKAVYDWSYGLALECVARADEDVEPERRVPPHLREAIFAVVAEKRFDPVPRTADRTERQLRQYSLARPYQECRTRAEMIGRIQGVHADDAWFATWKRLYCQQDASDVTDADVELVADEDSLVGWTAANLARRGSLTEANQHRIREMYTRHRSGEGRRSVRWRVVHVLGRWPSAANVAQLDEAIASDPYHWVRYGAARSLIEIAARSTGVPRDQALAAIRSFVSGTGGGPARHMILREIAEASLIGGAAAGWVEAAFPVLERVVAAETSRDRKAILSDLASELRNRALLGRSAVSPAMGRMPTSSLTR